MTIDKFIKENVKITMEPERWVVSFGGEYHDETYNKSSFDAQGMMDAVYDEVEGILQVEYAHYCQFCNEYFNDDPLHRQEDTTFLARYGDTVVWGGDNVTVPVCPFCKEDL